MLKVFALLTLLASSAVQAQTTLQSDLPLKYIEQVHADAEARPLVIFLHGYGSNEADLIGMKFQLPAQYNYLSVQAPLSLGEGRFQWFRKKGEGAYNGETDDLKVSGQKLRDFVAQAAQKYHTTPSKVYLIGFSQGAMMTYEVGLRPPVAVGGIAALSGRLLPVLKAELKGEQQPLPLSIFIGHGTADDPVPYKNGTEANTQLQKLGYKPQFHAYPGVGHSISAAELRDLSGWLQQLNP
ncbi:prolyl oligopeptidase family serine peptidase [Pseudomonas sp. B21-041]|jgi:phospholipase/carboxylesterase|uniref:Prolyl oligopeptidase family serine peptidase n=1 Tax=Pseudomonas germanica TaxID=2815720 RepID=A0ABX8YJ42_9PSED|nr:MULTISPECIES: prolyl oligopeptidase family serine peptidase [Pseudomonas]QYY79765.1 prolyl oligopeptidase family serine peptidase [Pseudomonas germanica]UVL32658.1 prolyl oligopeptidase family serine peptidase [Pseudomonas sp. B21-041]